MLDAVREAKTLYERHGAALLQEELLVRLLDRYRKAVLRTRQAMRSLRIVDFCSACAGRPAGSCCFEEVASWYDSHLLTVNLLLGVEAQDSPEVEGHCLFVGPHGCRLLARHSFCVNYLCPGLKAFLGANGTTEFSAVAGEELACGWEVEKYLHRWLRLNVSR